MGGHVFISYSQRNRQYVDKLAAHLRHAQIPVWYDYEMVAGDRFASVIQTQIDNAVAVVVVLTPASRESEWVHREISYAIRVSKPILPLLLERCDPHILLVALNEEDVTGGRMPSRRFVDRLLMLTREPSPMPPDAPTRADLDDVIAAHIGPVSSIAWSPDGRLATAGVDRTVRIWDPPTTTPQLTLTGHTGAVTAVAWSTDGRRLATASADGTARIWSATRGEAGHTFSGHIGAVQAVAWSSERSQLATGGEDGSIRIWDGNSGAQMCVLRGHKGAVACVSWSVDGRYLASTGSDGCTRVWDLESCTALYAYAQWSVRSVCWLPDGRVAGTRDGIVWTGDLSTRVRRRAFEWSTTEGESFQVSPQYVNGQIQIAPDGTWLAASSNSSSYSYSTNGMVTYGSVRVLDSASGAGQVMLPYNGAVPFVAIAPDGLWIAVADNGTNGSSVVGTVRVWDIANGAERVSLSHRGGVTALAIASDGTWLASASAESRVDRTRGRTNVGAVRLWDVATGSERVEVSHAEFVTGLAIAPDSSWFVTAGSDGTARIWDVAGRRRATIQHGGRLRDVQIASDGSWFATAEDHREGYDWKSSVRLWDASTGAERVSLAHGGQVTRMAIAPDGLWLATACGETVSLWDAATGSVRAILPHRAKVTTVAIAHDGTWLATADSMNHLIWIWESRTGVQRSKLGGHTGPVTDIAIAPDGTWLASAGSDNTIRVCDLVGRSAQATTLAGYMGASVSEAWSSDRLRLAIFGDKGTIRTWDARSGAALREVKGGKDSPQVLAWSPDGLHMAGGGKDGTVRFWEV
jgi:WD40 repeat protein